MTSPNLFIIVAILGACFVIIFVIVFFRVRLKGKSRNSDVESSFRQASNVFPLVSKEIPEVKSLAQLCRESPDSTCVGEVTLLKKGKPDGAESVAHQLYENYAASSDGGLGSSEIVNPGWGKWYTVKELETATRGFADDNIIGEGGYGVVYRGVLPDGTDVAVKNLLNKKGQAEKDFIVEVEAIGRVRHKNLVGLLGYCAEGDRRLLVYEYVVNGNLEQWLHNKKEDSSPLTWDTRMRIAIGAAKGLAYLHEGLEPKVVHRDVKSSNILLDKMWNPKLSDFGLAKLLGSEANYVATRVMGTFGYVSPDYASTGMLNATSDVYSYGVLLMEMITGRSPIDYTRPAAEINLVDWLKGMVANRRIDDIVDPRLVSRPSGRALRRALLVCLRCLDLDSTKRPKMGQVVHMLEADDSPFRTEFTSKR